MFLLPSVYFVLSLFYAHNAKIIQIEVRSRFKMFLLTSDILSQLKQY
jgi:hypothetical protein